MTQILLVEDDPLFQDIAVSILQGQGMDVDVASNGFAALRLLRDVSYDAALVDYHLPEMDGFTLARLMHDVTDGRNKPLRLIGVTADRHGLAARRGAGNLFDAIVAKPYDPLELAKLLEVAPEGRPQATQSPAIIPDRGHGEARLMAASFWRARGLQQMPRATVFPFPTPQQRSTIQMCFDVVESDNAEIIVVIDARGLQELLRTRVESNLPKQPIVSLDPSLATVSDAYFAVADRESWTAVANLLTKRYA